MEQNQNQGQPFKCTGDCLTCRALNERKTQWQYCASQFTYNTMRMVEAMQSEIVAMQGTVNELKAKIDAIQNSEALVFDPLSESLSENSSEIGKIIGNTAQSGDGAESRSPETV